MNYTENNKLIAEFMGFVEVDSGWYNYMPQLQAQDLKYHVSWDWLMPVVDKIERIVFDEENSFNVTIGSGIYCVVQDLHGECYEMIYDDEETKIEAVYKAVVDFIKWHNENK